jgi:uncharacterized membrane protein YgaE (UPF0421/DUF939 family)
MKGYIHTTIKMGVAGIITVLIANVIGLEYAITGGILAILSIQQTKKDSVLLALKRVISATIGLLLASLVFVIFGYHLWVFFIFMIIFIFGSFLIKLPEGIIATLVLASHLLIFGSFSWVFLGQEFLLIAIAIVIALCVNIIYPQNSQKVLMSYIKNIDRLIADHLFMLSLLMKDLNTSDIYMTHHKHINSSMKEILKKAELIDKDILFDNDHRYLIYLYMRRTQMKQINKMYEISIKIKAHHDNILLISKYINQLSFDIGCFDRASGQLDKLNALLFDIKNQVLPKTRDEFETRAILFQVVNELEDFLQTKISFHQQFPLYECGPKEENKGLK